MTKFKPRWLIEKQINGTPHWAKYRASRITWHADAYEATHFSRQEDAVNMIYSQSEGIVATEHQFTETTDG